jgi:hypothetical protein
LLSHKDLTFCEDLFTIVYISSKYSLESYAIPVDVAGT